MQWIVAQTTSGRGEVCGVLRATGSGYGHHVNNVWPDGGAALTSARCRMQLARRVNHLPADYRSGCERSQRQAFSSWVAFTLSAPHGDGRPPNSPKRGTFGGYSVMPGRCNFLPQARDIIVSRPIGLFTFVRMVAAPLYRAAQCLLCPDLPTTMRHPCATPCAGIHAEESEGRAQSVNARERV